MQYKYHEPINNEEQKKKEHKWQQAKLDQTKSKKNEMNRIESKNIAQTVHTWQWAKKSITWNTIE